MSPRSWRAAPDDAGPAVGRKSDPDLFRRASGGGKNGQRLEVVVGYSVNGPHGVEPHRFAFLGEVHDVFRFG